MRLLEYLLGLISIALINHVWTDTITCFLTGKIISLDKHKDNFGGKKVLQITKNPSKTVLAYTIMLKFHKLG